MGGEDAIKKQQIRDSDPPISLRIEPLAPQHAATAAGLHISGQTGTFLTALGPDVLEIIYETLPRTDGGFGYAATVHGGDASETVAGFVSATTNVGGLFISTVTTRANRLLPTLVSRYAHRPALLGRSVQTALYPFISTSANKEKQDEAGRCTAELLSIMVEQNWRSHGIGALLLEALLADCTEREITHLDVTVDATNDGARRFYTRHGFVQQRTFRLYGRDMCSYGRRVVRRGV